MVLDRLRGLIHDAKKLSIALTDEMAAMVREAVGSGVHASASEVIRDAFRTWKGRRLIGQLWDEGLGVGRRTRPSRSTPSRQKHDGGSNPFDVMARVYRGRQARQDLIALWLHVTSDDPAAADRLLDRTDAKCALLAENPRMGPVGDDIRPGLRYGVVESHVIFYRTIGNGIEVVRVVHGARDLLNLL